MPTVRSSQVVRRCVLTASVVALVVACAPGGSPPPASSAPATSASHPTPASSAPGTSEGVIDAFLAFARSPDQTFAVSITGDFTVGAHRITYDMSGGRSGGDAFQTGTETSDGTRTPFGSAVIGGRLYSTGDGGAWQPTDASSEVIAFYADSMLSFSRALVLEDLGRDARSGLHRLRVSAGFSLFPPQMSANAILDGHDETDRLELVVTDAGVPVEATYTRTCLGHDRRRARHRDGDRDVRLLWRR